MLVTIICSLGAAFLNAVSAVMQRRLAGQPDVQELFRGQFIKNLAKNWMWIGAFGLQVLAFLLQAAALKSGSLVVVEPLLTVDLVFLLLILHSRFHLKTGWLEWGAVALICVGLGGLIASANPQIGHRLFSGVRWGLSMGIIVTVICISIFIVRRTKSGRQRAAIAGMAAGFSFALVAMLTKLVTQQLGQYGFGGLFSHWAIYGLLLFGILSIIMTQNTYGAGPVVVSQPVMELCEPLIAALMGILLFGDSINLDTISLTLEAITAVMAGTGIWLLSRSENLHIHDL